MEISERLTYLPKYERLEVDGELLLAVTFAVLSQTGVHFLNHENWQTRVAFQMYPEELHYTGMTQFGPSQTFRLKVADEFSALGAECREGVLQRTRYLSNSPRTLWHQSLHRVGCR